MGEPSRVERWERSTEIPLLLLAVALMIVGIGFVGAVIASVTSWMVGQVGQRSDDA